ncbi:oligosaccharide flippase family protein [Clostridium tertium]|uniref:oligosaccharide flippase family protein n=1 Tax=Clostridium tertium TaxID=1559 RepID=UPI0024B369A9|nr:oligosaccharide flippase family protein [Clostridium tertium]MDI9217004.1 oligosaccharide flippase family protein [Clostridium tertium]
MSKEKQLVKNTLIYAIGNFGSKLLTFLLLPIYTKYLLKSEYGYFDLIVNTVSLLMPIISFQVMDGIYRFILVEEDKDEQKKYISNGVLIVIRNILLFTIVYVIAAFVFKMQNSVLIYLYLITTIFYTLWAQITRGLKKNLDYSIAGVIITIVTLSLNIIFIVKFNFRVNGLIVSYIIANLIAIIYLEYKVRIVNLVKLSLKENTIKNKLNKYSIPLIPNTMSWWMMNVSDRYMITYFLDASVNGLYAMANKFSSIIVIINSFFSLAWQESAILEYNKNDRDEYYTRMFNVYMKLQFTGMLVLLPLTRLVFNILIKGEYVEGYRLVPILYMASIFSAFSVFYGTGYLSVNDTKGSFYTTIIGALLNIFINIFTIPVLGIYGAGVSTLLSYLVVWILRVIQTKKYFKINIDKKSFSVLLILNIIFSILYYIPSLKLQLLIMIVSIVIFIIYNKELVKKILNLLTKIKFSR